MACLGRKIRIWESFETVGFFAVQTLTIRLHVRQDVFSFSALCFSSKLELLIQNFSLKSFQSKGSSHCASLIDISSLNRYLSEFRFGQRGGRRKR